MSKASIYKRLKTPKSKPPRWRKIHRNEYCGAEAFLREREKFCVSASARFLGLRESRGHVWRLGGRENEISALLLHSRRSLYPVFNQAPGIPAPRFLNRFLGKVPIHALQGLREDVETLETLMKAQGYFANEQIDYELLSLDSGPGYEVPRAGPSKLIVRPAAVEDREPLVSLQAAYEQEEVLPENAVFNAAVSRLNMEHILSHERVFVAEMNSEVVGKINTSAESFTRYQIGGVYVRPDYRGLGIGVKMTSVFIQNLLALDRGITLFVKRRNTVARAVYRKAGFSVLAEYRITYY